MSGHSKWATIEHKKTATDARRGKLFTRLTKNIEVVVHTGGGDPVGNPTLFDAIQRVKENPVPVDNITHAVKCGSGVEAGGANYETVVYEGYDSGGVAFYVECLTDSHNRTAPNVRLVFTRSNGPMADSGLVAFLFSRRGIVEVAVAEGADEDPIIEAVPRAGAEEVEDLGGGFAIESDLSDAVEVCKALQMASIDRDFAEVQFVVVTGVEFDLEGVVKVQRFVDALEDSDDVQNIYHNMTVSDEVRTQLEGEG